TLSPSRSTLFPYTTLFRSSGYEIPDHNPIIINTTDDFVGLGHNSIVMGPNLDSYYVVYHNLVGSSAEGPPVRQMNIDRFVFNGRSEEHTSELQSRENLVCR